jgi:hypothetical protein
VATAWCSGSWASAYVSATASNRGPHLRVRRRIVDPHAVHPQLEPAARQALQILFARAHVGPRSPISDRAGARGIVDEPSNVRGCRWVRAREARGSRPTRNPDPIRPKGIAGVGGGDGPVHVTDATGRRRDTSRSCVGASPAACFAHHSPRHPRARRASRNRRPVHGTSCDALQGRRGSLMYVNLLVWVVSMAIVSERLFVLLFRLRINEKTFLAAVEKLVMAGNFESRHQAVYVAGGRRGAPRRPQRTGLRAARRLRRRLGDRRGRGRGHAAGHPPRRESCGGSRTSRPSSASSARCTA